MRAIRIIGLFLTFTTISVLSIAQNAEIEDFRQSIASATSAKDSLDHSLTLAQNLRPFSTDSVAKYASMALSLAEKEGDNHTQREGHSRY